MLSRAAGAGARRSGLAGALLAAVLVSGAFLFGPPPGAVADVAPTANPTVVTVTTAANWTPTVPLATASASPTNESATAIGTTQKVVTATASASEAPQTPFATATATATAAASGTARATATATVGASPSATPVAVNAGVTARSRLMANAYASAPSVDLMLVGAPSLVLGPGQVVWVDVQAWAGASSIVGIDAFLDFDASRIQVDHVDLEGSPFTTILQRTWDNESGQINLSLGRIVGETGTGASGYFRVARIAFRATAGFASGSSASTARLTFAADHAANRETTVLTRTSSVLRNATGATIALNPNAVALATPAPDRVSMVDGIPASITFTMLDASNRPAPNVSYSLEARGAAALIGPTSGSTDANGVAIASVKGTPSGASGLVMISVGGTLTQARVIEVTTAVAANVTIASPTFTLARGLVPVVATTTFGPVPLGSRFEVEWRFRTEAGGKTTLVEPAAVVPVVGGIATATWDTTAIALAPAGVTRSDVILEAEARAVDAVGNVVGLATSTFGPMLIDNQAPALGAVSTAGQPMADDPTIRTRIATRTFAVSGVTEEGSTVAVYRRASVIGARPSEATPMATVIANSVGALRARTTARAVTAPATASFMVDLPAFGEADEIASGFYVEVEATDPAGNVGPVTLSTVNGRPVATANPYQGWLTLDTVAPRVVTIASPTFTVGDANAGSRPVEITFSEPVALRPSDFGTKVRLEQEILDIPEPIAGTLQVVCADDVRPTGTVPVTPSADGSCASGVTVARIVPSVPWYPGGTYHVTIASGDDTVAAGMAPVAVADLAGNKLVAASDGGASTAHMAFIAPGAPAYPTAKIGGILATESFNYVVHGTAANPVPLRAATTNVDTDLDWRLCTSQDCKAATPTSIAIASPSFEVRWDTEATVGGTRTFPDVRDAFVVAHGRNRQISGEPGHITDVRRVTLRSVGPVLTEAEISVAGKRDTRPAAGGTFVIADDEDPAVPGLQARFTGTIADAVPGTVMVSQVGREIAVGANTTETFITAVGTVNDGLDPDRKVTLQVIARDEAIPVANQTTIELVATVDTVAPGVTISYPIDRSRLAAPSGTTDLPFVGMASEAATVTFKVSRNSQTTTLWKDGPEAADVVTGTDGKFTYPLAGAATPTFRPGNYVLTATATDRFGNPGSTATSTFQITPPPPPALLSAPGTSGPVKLIGPVFDEDTGTAGVQVTLSGRLCASIASACDANPVADDVPQGLIAILRRNGVDVAGDGGRLVAAPVVSDGSGAYTFAFPPQTFARSATATFTVVTRDTAGYRSPESVPVPVSIDLTAPVATIAAPRPGSAVGSTTPEIAVAVSTLADGTYDATTATFAVRKSGESEYQVVGDVSTSDASLKATGGIARLARWANPLSNPTGTPAKQAYDLRVTLTDTAGNVTILDSTFILQPGIPSLTLTRDGVPVLSIVDISQEATPAFTVDANATGDGVTITGVTATLKNRATGAVAPLTLGGAAGARTVTLPNESLPNGSVHDLEAVATDSNGAKASTGATIRVIRPRSINVTVTRGATPVTGAAVSVRRAAGLLPAVTTDSGPNDQFTDSDGSVKMTGIPGGDVVIAIDGVPGYPTTTVVASVTEPQATADAPWVVALDLDALNANAIVTALRGLPSSVTNSASTAVGLDVTPAAGARYISGTTPAHVRQTFGDDVARVNRAAPSPAITVANGIVTAQTRVPLGAVAWKVVPRLVGDAASAATIKGATSSDAIFTGSTSGETIDTAFRYVDSNLRVKTLTGTVRLPNGIGVAEARVVVSAPGGLSQAVTTDLEGNFGPLKLEAGEYVVAPQATAGAAWLPGRTGRVAFRATDDSGNPAPEADRVDLVVEPAGGTLVARLTRGTRAELTSGTVVLRGEGRTITARAESAVLPGQDDTTGYNVNLGAPGGTYRLTVVPDDTTLAAPDEVAVRIVSGQTKAITDTELPPLQRTLGRLTGKVRLTTGSAVAGMTVQARREGDASVTPATTDESGEFSLAVPPGRYEVSAVVPRGAAVLAGTAVTGTVAAQSTAVLADIVLTPASAVIERTLVKPGSGTTTVALTDDEAASLSGTALVKDQTTGRSTSVAFSGDRIRISVAPGTYRLGISVATGGFLAPEAESSVVATAGTPNAATRTITPSNVLVAGQLVTGTTSDTLGSPVALRATVRATGLGGPATGVVKVTESDASGTFRFSLAQGTWRFAASPDASQGYLANVARPYVDVTVGASGSVSPTSPAIDLSPANKVISGTTTVAIDGVEVPLVGVRVRADVSGTDGSFVSIDTESAQDGTFSIKAPTGSVVVAAIGASARYGVATGSSAADAPAYVIDPKPIVISSGAPTTDLPVRFENAAIKVAGTVTSGGRNVAGATVSAMSTSGLVRTTTSLGGSKAGTYELRLSAGEWAISATADLTTDSGARVPAKSAAVSKTVSADVSGVGLDLIAAAVELPPVASGSGDPETGAQIRAGRESAQLTLAAFAVNESVNVTVEPLGSVPTMVGFVPFGDAFQVGLTSKATGLPITNVSVDSTVLITYALDSLRKFRLASASVAAQPSDLRAARYDSITGTYTPISTVTSTKLSDSLGQFAISTSVMGTYVLTTSEALVRIPAKVTGVTAVPSSGTLRTGDRVAITVTFDDAVTVTNTPRLALSTGRTGSYATFTSGSGTTALTFTYTVVAGDTATDLDYTSTSAIDTTGGAIKTSDGVDADVTLAPPGQSGSISATSSIVIDTTTSGGDNGSGGSGSGGSGSGSGGVTTVAQPITTRVPEPELALPIAPVSPSTSVITATPGLATERLAAAIAAVPGGISPAAAAAVGDALAGVDLRTARAFIDTMADLPPAQAAHVLMVIAAGTPEEARAAVAAVSALPPGATIARPGGSLRGPNGAETFTYNLDDGEARAPQASLVGSVEVAGARHAITGRGPVVFLVRSGQAALVTRPRSGAWPDLRFPLLAGFLAGTGPAIALPAEATSITFEPAPDGLNIVERGSLGGGIVVPLARPFAVRVEATDPTARVGFALPSPTVGPGQVLAYLHSLRAPSGKFQGYLRAPASFDGATGSQTWALDARAASDVLVLVGAIQPGYVQNFDASAHIYSGPDDLAVDFGEAGPAFTTFTVVGPQVDKRIYVYSPVTKAYGWIDSAGVGPSGPPPADGGTPGQPSPSGATVAGPKPRESQYVQARAADIHLWSEPYPAAKDFGPVGEAGAVFEVIDGPENGHLFVRSTRSGAYAWIDLNDAVPSGPPGDEPATSPPATTTARPTSEPARPAYVQNVSASAHLFSSPFDDAADFGPVGAAFVTFTVVGGPENGHLQVIDSRTRNIAWIEARDVGPSGAP